MYRISATVRGPKGQRHCWLPVSMVVHADSLADARRTVINHCILAGLEYGSLDITYDLPAGDIHEHQSGVPEPVPQSL